MFTSKKYIFGQLTKDIRFNEDEYQSFILEGVFDEEDPDLQEILKEDPDIYIVGDKIGGLELSRKSFWA